MATASLFSTRPLLPPAARRPLPMVPPISRDSFKIDPKLVDFHAGLRSPLLVGGGDGGGDDGGRNEFYLNLGMAVRTLREDLPLVFSRDLNYEIYRADITFSDPLNSFQGIDSYRLIFWALRFHGRMLFREIELEVLRIWQLSDDVILIRWRLKGVPRVPWEARGEFQGTSKYKLDRRGKIYDHKVDNLAVNFPKVTAPPLRVAAGLDLVAPSPCPPVALLVPGGEGAMACNSSWIEFYRAVERTLDQRKSLLADDPPRYIDANPESFAPLLLSFCIS
ncbi:uncharacterized protein LOC144707515 [Wolffia australiana]